MSVVFYQGRQIPARHFRVILKNAKGEEICTESYKEYLKLTESGDWFDGDVKQDVPRGTLEQKKDDVSKKKSKK